MPIGLKWWKAHKNLKQYRASFRALLDFMKEEPRTYAVVIALAVVVGILELAGVGALVPGIAVQLGDALKGFPRFVARAIGTPSPLAIGFILGGLILAQTAVNYIREAYFLTRMARWRTNYSLEYLRGIIASDWFGFGTLQPGEVEVILTRNIGQSMRLRHMTANLAASTILAALYIVITVALAWYTMFLFAILALIFALLHGATLRWRMHYAVAAKQRYIEVARRVIEYFADARGVLIHRAAVFLQNLRRSLDEAAHAQRRNDQLNVFFVSIHQPLIIAVFIASAGVLYSIGQPLSTIVGIFYIFYRAAPHIVNVARNYGEILGETPIDVVPEITAWRRRIPVPAQAPLAPRGTHISFKEVTLGYGDKVLLQDVSLEIVPGALVCIVGKSGTGKSTILDALCGFRFPSKGAITLGGVDVSHLDWNAWRSRIGLVRNESVVVSGTWVDNVAFLDNQPNYEKIERLISQVELQDLVNRAPDGIRSLITARGGNLSAGQRQRLLLARALYRDPALLILDEPTSNLDINTEQFIQDFLLSLKGKMTIIIVSHSPAMQKHADRVYEVSAAGSVREVAPHAARASI